MFVRGTTLSSQEVVPPVPFIQVRALHKVQLGAIEDSLGWADELALLWAELLKPDTGKSPWASPVILQHVDEPFLAVIIVKKGWIESWRIDINGIWPWTFDAFCSYNVVWGVFERTVLALYICIDQPKLFTVMW
jgi:hypothetical protein